MINFIFTLWMRVGKWIFGATNAVMYHHKGRVRGFTLCRDNWYADKVMNIRKDQYKNIRKTKKKEEENLVGTSEKHPNSYLEN